jgi:SAM-dependent methyltransferase
VQRLEKFFYRRRPDWRDGTEEFREVIGPHIAASKLILDAGAGCHSLWNWRGQGRIVIGIDLDRRVQNNPGIDIPVVGDLYRLPFAANSFDVIYSDYVWEHLHDPEAAAREFLRVLRPGGVFALRTPNQRHYVSVAARLTPHWVHAALNFRLRGTPKENVFPTVYAANTRARLQETLQKVGFETLTLLALEKEPSYLMWNPVAYLCGVLYERVVNRTAYLEVLRANWLAVARKPLRKESCPVRGSKFFTTDEPHQI